MNDSLVVLAFPADTSASHHSNGSGSPEPLDHPVAFFEVADDVLFDLWYAPPGAAIVHTDNLQVSVEDRQSFDCFQGCIRLHRKYQHSCGYGHFVCHRRWGSMVCVILKIRFEVLVFLSIQVRWSFSKPDRSFNAICLVCLSVVPGVCHIGGDLDQYCRPLQYSTQINTSVTTE